MSFAYFKASDKLAMGQSHLGFITSIVSYGNQDGVI